MFDGDDKILTENTCCLCLNDDESTFSATTIMKSLPLHEMVNFCIGIELTGAQSYHKLFKLSTICNECVLHVSNFYAFKQRILTAQKALTECAESEGCGNLLETNSNETRTSYENLTGNAADQNEKVVQHHEFDAIEAPTEGAKNVDTDEEAEYLILQESDTHISEGKPTEVTTNATHDNAVAARRRNPSKRKRAEQTMSTEKVAIQVNECLVCPAVLSDILELNEHTAAHTAPLFCKVCQRSFVRYANLKRHFITAHSKPKPFVCDLCGLGFSFSVNLQTHASLHYSGKIQTKNTK